MMTKIILKFKDKVLKEIPVEKELITIGRKPDNDIEIDNLAVSGHHARIFKMEDWFLVEDLNSLNGTFVNGKMIQEYPLKNGDEILIGKHVLKFISTDVSGSKEPEAVLKKGEASETMVIDSKVQQEMLAQISKDRSIAGTGEVMGRITILEGSTDKKEYDLAERMTSIGKESSAKIRLKGFFAPKFAAFVNRSKEGYFISAASGKELRINGEVVSGKYKLQDGDIIQVAGIKMDFDLRE
jgi:pSer/pThr/pTyr-binding forkhead associated (FHA) protein